MDLLKTVSNILGAICIIIGIGLLPLAIWMLSSGLRNKDRPMTITSAILFVLAALVFYGAYTLFTQGVLQTSPYLQPGR